MQTPLSDARQMRTEDIVAQLSHLIYEKAKALEFPDGEVEAMRRYIDELEYRFVIHPEVSRASEV